MATAFSSDECNVLAQALEAAWEIFLRSRRLETANIDTAKAALTRSILAVYENGEHNPRRLAIAAVAQLDSPQAAFLAGRSVSPAA